MPALTSLSTSSLPPKSTLQVSFLPAALKAPCAPSAPSSVEDMTAGELGVALQRVADVGLAGGAVLDDQRSARSSALGAAAFSAATAAASNSALPAWPAVDWANSTSAVAAELLR